MVATGLDVLRDSGFEALRGKSVGILCNQASIDSNLDHVLDLLLQQHRTGFLRLHAIFGPQHGLFGHTQDNMIEWEGGYALGSVPVFSLYGEHRKPTAQMLQGVDILLVDLQDVGARYYTFIWTLALCMEACAERSVPLWVLDRPNPLGGLQIGGTVLQTGFESFVGLYPLPMRHGMTIGEVAMHLSERYIGGLELRILEMCGWSREMRWAETGQTWAMPSPNMPTPDTATVYPGGCLLEATNLSEGRGTTRPFAIAGAPWLDAHRYSEALNRVGLAGVKFRPLQFEPAFNKYAKELCNGCFIHVTDADEFDSVLATVAMMQEAIRQGAGRFSWKQPPYEYELVKLPIDILAGNEWFRVAIESLLPLAEISERMSEERSRWDPGEPLYG